MLRNLINLYSTNGDIIATIEDKEDYDEVLPQLNNKQQSALFASMEDAIHCYETGEGVTVNADNFSDIMCDWSCVISAYEDDETDIADENIIFEYFKEEYEIPDDADYYTIQEIGWGGNGYIRTSFYHKHEALEYIKEYNLKKENIIPQYVGEEFNHMEEYDYPSSDDYD